MSLSTEACDRVVVTTGAVARQWVVHLERQRVGSGGSRRPAPRVQTYAAWIRSLWQRTDDPRPVLSVWQSRALWRQVVRESSAVQDVLRVDALATAAESAWRTLRAADVDASDLKALRQAGETADCLAFAGWARTYRARLATAGWLEQADLPGLLCRRIELGSPEAVRLDASLQDVVHQQLSSHLRTCGWRVEAAAPACAERVVRMQASDAQTELLNAVSWLTARMRDDASAVLVVPDLAGREAEVAQTLDRAAGRLGWCRLGGQPAGRKPMIAAAASALRLFSEDATFSTLSRWLRSPFFGCEDASVRAGIERALRDSVAAQIPFRDAYGRAGLRSRLGAHSARLGRAVDSAFRLIAENGPRQTPTRWTQVWSQLLETLGWCGGLPDTEPDVVAGWDEALGAFAELTPILGSLGWSRACVEFTALLERPVWQGPVPQTTLYLADTLEELGPGHAAVWVTGATDRRWPKLRPMSPFVPRWFAAQHGTAFTTALEQSHREFDQLRTAGREIVLSWPRREADIPCSQSSLLEGLPQVTPEALMPTPKSSGAPLAELEVVADPAPPFLAERIPGGTRALALQSSCPARAFCELRLGARALPLHERGTSRARRGTMLHTAVQMLLRRLPTREALASDSHIVEAAIKDSVAEVLNRALGSVRSALPSLYEIESLVLTATLGALVRFELAREPFEVAALEFEASFHALGRVVALRLDRIDRLSDGRRVVIDYKTGSAPRAVEWLAQPPLEPQLPLYALALWPDVSAVVALLLQPDRVQATGFWPAEAFPMRSVKSAEGIDWAAQIKRWRQGVESLICEFIGGDTRVFSQRRAEAGGELAAITRVLELPPASGGPIDE